MEKWDIWDYLAWGSLLVLLLWAIGKSVGLIHSPVWVQMIPTFTGIVAGASLFVKLGEYKSEFRTMKTDIHIMKNDIKKIPKIETEIHTMKTDIHEIKGDLKEIHKHATCLKGNCNQ